MGEISMSLRRLVATVDVSTVNVAELCRLHGISRDRFYAIRRRYATEGEAGLEPRSRAPHRVANRTKPAMEDEIVAMRKRLLEMGLDGGAVTIHWHLSQEAAAPSAATIWRVLTRRGFITPQPEKRPKKTWGSFSAARGNECWQMDSTHATLGGGEAVEVVNVVDDCTRVCVASLAVPSATGAEDAWRALVAGISAWGLPQRVLCDNGTAFTSRLVAANLEALGIGMSHSRPYHPQTCGKVERLHQTQRRFLTAQGTVPTLGQLQEQLDRFGAIYNHQRPHRALGRRTPAEVYGDTPRSGPDNLPLGTPTTIHRNTVDANGRVEIPGPYTIALGAAHAGRTATTIRTGDRAHVFVDHQLIRQLTLDTSRRSQPLYQRPGRPSTAP